LAPHAEDGGTGAWHGGGEAVKAVAALLGARCGRRCTGGPDRAERPSGVGWFQGKGSVGHKEDAGQNVNGLQKLFFQFFKQRFEFKSQRFKWI
jgi:hypothetical protein